MRHVLVLCAVIAGCASRPLSESEVRAQVPAWYIPVFKLAYPDGRVYEGECLWPESFDDGFRFDIKSRQAIGDAGRTVTAVYEVENERAFNFIPHGKGAMTRADGTRQEGYWKNGNYVGESMP